MRGALLPLLHTSAYTSVFKPEENFTVVTEQLQFVHCMEYK
jgi:hypothetical protein